MVVLYREAPRDQGNYVKVIITITMSTTDAKRDVCNCIRATIPSRPAR